MTTPNTGNFRVANYETAQPAKLAYETTPYCWAVETRYGGDTETGGGIITADLAGRKGKPRHRHPYWHGGSSGENHTEAALQFMRAYVLPPNSHATLVSMASTEKGFLFIFV
jgi:hypothetical protein